MTDISNEKKPDIKKETSIEKDNALDSNVEEGIFTKIIDFFSSIFNRSDKTLDFETKKQIKNILQKLNKLKFDVYNYKKEKKLKFNKFNLHTHQINSNQIILLNNY